MQWFKQEWYWVVPAILFGAAFLGVCVRLIRKRRRTTRVDDDASANQDLRQPQEVTPTPAVVVSPIPINESAPFAPKPGSSKTEEEDEQSASEASREQRIRAEIDALHRARVEQSQRIEAKTVARAGTRDSCPERPFKSILPEFSHFSRPSPEGLATTQPSSSAESAEDFRFITSLFDDPSPEVRNVAARALYHLQSDRAASFTRALREGSPERRRRIAAAIESSGLASDALASLAGQNFDKSYDAFSMLFLLAKAGEMRLLIKAIEDGPNLQVRLAIVKLLALSGQPEVVPAFRRLALRSALPPEVRAAVMETIHPSKNF